MIVIFVIHNSAKMRMLRSICIVMLLGVEKCLHCIFFRLPETPKEPDPELITRTEPKLVPLHDVMGQDNIHDHRDKYWPEPILIDSSSMNYGYGTGMGGGGGMGGGMPGGGGPGGGMGAPPSGGGSHWVVGGPPAAPVSYLYFPVMLYVTTEVHKVLWSYIYCCCFN